MAVLEEAASGGRPSGGADIDGLAAEILEWIQDGFYAIDREWRFIYANRRACELWGAARETVVGRVLWERFPQIVGTPAGERLREAVEAGAASEFETLSPVVGRWLWLRVDPIRPGITGVYWRDITERKRAEEALRESEERFRRVFEQSPLGKATAGPDFRFREVNPALCSMLGYTAEELTGMGFLDVVHPADRDVCLRHGTALAIGEVPHFQLEERFLRKSGEPIWVNINVGPIRDADGRILYSLGIIENIDERKRITAALRASEERLKLAQDGAGVGLWDWNIATNEIHWSPQMFRILGLDPERDAADPYAAWLRVLHPEDREEAHAKAQWRRLHPDPSEYEFRIVRPDGAVRWIYAKGMAVATENGRPVRVAGINIDVTDRKRIEAELRQLTERLEARVEARTRELADVNERLRRERMLSDLIIESAVEGIIVVDTDLRIVVWNAAMESINGLRREEVLGKTLFEAFPHLCHSAVGQMWQDAVAGRRAEARDRQWFAPARGEEIVYDADYTPLYDQERSIIGAIGIVRETTERRRMEEMLRQSQKMEAVAQLTGGVAHDFNNLLTAVVGCLDIIALEAKSDRIATLVQTALRSANRGARLTQQLLSFARRQTLRPVAADLNALLGEMEMLLRRAAGETVETVIDGMPDLWRCEVDPAQFEAAVMNLVMNARDAMPKGGALRLETRNVDARHISEDVELRPGDYIAFTVRDAGDGMTPDVQAKAFEPFFTTKEIGKGSGLGLSMVYGFAKQSGGGVRLESAPGAGTSVTLYLPRAPSPAEMADPARADDRPQAGSGSVLVVEDDDDVREVSVATLRALGYRVSVARNGHEALAVLRGAEPIDLLFTDIVMPRGLSGLELARQAQAVCPGVKVLLTTGYAGSDAPGVGEFAMIAKPFRPAELSRVLAGLMAEPRPASRD